MHILVVDDNRTSADALARALKKRGDEVQACYDGASAIQAIEAGGLDLVLTDLRMEPVDGMEVLRAARDQRPPVDVVVFTAYGAVETAVEAMQLGALDFLTKPVTLEQLVARLEDLQGVPSPSPAPSEQAFIATSEGAVELLNTLQRAAGVPSPVWIEGEIGTGRGHAAATLHRLGSPNDPFVVLDVTRSAADAPLPASGTVLLPNLDTLPLDLQRDLVRRLRSVPEGVRLVATSGPDARQRVAEGALDAELYYKLAVIVVVVPPLRERREDIAPLLRLALTKLAARYNRPAPVVRPDVEARLTQHAWPGNVRELFNVAERAVVLGPEALSPEIIRTSSTGLPTLEPGFSLASWLDRMERRVLMEALRRSDGDRNAAGKLLGVERNTLRYKLLKHKLIEK